MKILLIGDLSGLHPYLAIGLMDLGHDVLVVSSGDGWKKMPADKPLPTPGNGIVSGLLYRLKLLILLLKVRDFDVVQISHLAIFPATLFPVRFVLKRLRKLNGVVSYVACSSDAFYLQNATKRMRYTPLPDFYKYDLNSATYARDKNCFYQLNKNIVSLVHCIIPVMFDYSVCYEEYGHLAEVIPLPVDTRSVVSKRKRRGDVIKVFHGLNSRPGFKGTHFVREAFDYLNLKYPGAVQCEIKGLLPINEYLKVLDEADIVVDQTSSYSLGINGVLALSLSKIVLGGAEPESVTRLSSMQSPVINIRPCAQDIIRAVERLIEDKNNFADLSRASRSYAEKVHDARAVATRYVDVWSRYFVV